MLGCIQPMSSPMMKRMLGFCCCCCAAAGTLVAVTATNGASKPRQNFLVILMTYLLTLEAARMGPAARARLVAPKSRRGVVEKESLHYGWKPKEAMHAL